MDSLVTATVDHEVMDDDTNPGRRPIYTRSSSNVRRILDQRIIDAYVLPKHTGSGGLKSVAFPSGMTAITSIFMVTLERVCQGLSPDAPDSAVPHVLIGDELYCDVARTLRYLHRLFRFVHEAVDIRNEAAVMAVAKKAGPNLAIVYIESCTNPSGQMMDFDILRRIKRVARRCIVCVDNTWLSSVVFNPLTCPAVDVVVESMTKYIGGGRCIGGMAVGASWILTKARKWVQIMGLFMPRIVCNTFVEGWTTLPQRIQQSSALALRVAMELEAQSQQPGSRVCRVLHPLSASHPTHAAAQRQMLFRDGVQLGPSVFLFHVDMRRKMDPDFDIKHVWRSSLRSDETMLAILAASGLRLETSYGSPYSKMEIADYGWSTTYDLKTDADPVAGMWIRLAVGYQDTFEHLFGGLKNMLAHIDAVPDTFPAESEPEMFLMVPKGTLEQPYIVDRSDATPQ